MSTPPRAGSYRPANAGAWPRAVSCEGSGNVVERILGPNVLRVLSDHDAQLDLVVDGEPVIAQRTGRVSRDALDDVVVRRDHDRLNRTDQRAGQLHEVPPHLVREDTGSPEAAAAASILIDSPPVVEREPRLTCMTVG